MSTHAVDYGTEGRPGNDVWTGSEINDEGDF